MGEKRKVGYAPGQTWRRGQVYRTIERIDASQVWCSEVYQRIRKPFLYQRVGPFRFAFEKWLAGAELVQP